MDSLHDVVVDFVEVSFDYGLEGLYVFGFFDNLQNGRPPTLQYMSVVNDNLVDSHC